MSSVAREAARIRRPQLAPPTAQAARVERLEDRLAELTPEEAIALLEQSAGPLEGAHYVLQRGSELELVDGDWYTLEGEFSLIDCRDPEVAAGEPDRDFSYWIGGLRLSSSPELLLPARSGAVHLPLFGGPGFSERLGWGSMHIRGTRVTRLERGLDLRIAEEEQAWARVLRRRLHLDPESSSEARFDGESSACPDELTLHLLVEESSIEWELLEGEDGPRSERIGETYTSRRLARATLELLRVSYAPEILDPEQRGIRYAADSNARVAPSRELRQSRELPLAAPAPPRSGGVLEVR